MISYPREIQTLLLELKRLPGVGPRSAERIAVWMLGDGKASCEGLSVALVAAASSVGNCESCGFFVSSEVDCQICSDSERDKGVIAVVEQPTDVMPLERTGAFRGLYHVLGGKLSPLDNVTPEDLRIDLLVERVTERSGEVEVILALGSDVEGEATSNYLASRLEGCGARVTRIAQGLPAGGGLENADELTLFRALDGRRVIGE